jgi:hypothetical protein
MNGFGVRQDSVEIKENRIVASIGESAGIRIAVGNGIVKHLLMLPVARN